MASMFLGNALGCVAILLIAAWKRSRRRRRRSSPDGLNFLTCRDS
jgi:hypothetical protein